MVLAFRLTCCCRLLSCRFTGGKVWLRVFGAGQGGVGVGLVVLAVGACVVCGSKRLVCSTGGIVSLCGRSCPVICFMPGEAIVGGGGRAVEEGGRMGSGLVGGIVGGMFSGVLGRPCCLYFDGGRVASASGSFGLSGSSSIVMLSMVVTFTGRARPGLTGTLAPVFRRSTAECALLTSSVVTSFAAGSLELKWIDFVSRRVPTMTEGGLLTHVSLGRSTTVFPIGRDMKTLGSPPMAVELVP